MRSVVVLMLLLVFVAGVAANGSRAQPIPRTSIAFSQCQRHGDIALDSRCRPGGGIVPDFEEAGFTDTAVNYVQAGDSFQGVDYDGDKWKEVVGAILYFAEFLMNNWDRLWGSPASTAAVTSASDALFDPLK